MNAFLKHIVQTVLPEVETVAKPAVRDFLVKRADTLVDGVLREGALRDQAIKFVQENVDLLVDEAFAALDKAVANA